MHTPGAADKLPGANRCMSRSQAPRPAPLHPHPHGLHGTHGPSPPAVHCLHTGSPAAASREPLWPLLQLSWASTLPGVSAAPGRGTQLVDGDASEATPSPHGPQPAPPGQSPAGWGPAWTLVPCSLPAGPQAARSQLGVTQDRGLTAPVIGVSRKPSFPLCWPIRVRNKLCAHGSPCRCAPPGDTHAVGSAK